MKPATRPIPLLMSVRELASGGIERDVAKLAIHLPRERFTPYVATFKPAGPRYEELITAGVPIVPIDLTSLLSANAVKEAMRLRRFLSDQKIRVVHSFDASAVFVTPVARMARTPVVLSSMLGSRNLLDARSQKLLAFTDRLVDAVVVNCEAMRTHLVSDWDVPRDRIELCYNGVETREFYPDSTQIVPEVAGASIVIGTVCVLRAEKNLTLLQSAFAKVKALSSNPKLMIVGSGPELEKLGANAAKLGIAGSSVFIPAKRDVVPYLRSMDIYVSTSYSEAFSNSILEAMACGVCPVGSRVGGTPELISDDEHGFLFESNNAIDLAEKLARLIQEPELRRSFGSRAAEFAATKLNISLNVERNMEIYEKYLRKKKALS